MYPPSYYRALYRWLVRQGHTEEEIAYALSRPGKYEREVAEYRAEREAA